MDPVAQAVSNIIKEQQAIIGPVALDQAKKVSGLEVSSADDIKVSGNKKEVLGNLVNQYSKLFGKASIEVCKEAIEPLSDKIPASDIPDILKN
ncbi:MAG: Uncharacterized protein G01um10147_735 [Microgenomates group bacterium Gr01-1014_7]|nr:MAG: Uncharacterized protein G01um10147_735 [Microgenomates group bacterium Gr01-1014_7]